MNKIQVPHDYRLLSLPDLISSRRDFLVAALSGLLLGLLFFWIGPILTLAILTVLVFVFVIFKAPEFVILIMLVFASGLLPQNWNRSFDLFVGHFQLTDLILVALLCLTIFRAITERDFKLRKTPLNLPIALFSGVVFLGIGTAVVKHGVKFSYATYEARILLYYTLFFAVINLIRTRQQIYRLIYGIFAIGIFIALTLILQVMLGFSFPSVFETYFKSDLLARAYHPGLIAVYMTIMALICLLVFPRPLSQVVMIWIALFVLGLGNSVSLGRNIVISTLFSLFLLLFLLNESQRKHWLQNILALALFAIAVFSLLKMITPTAAILDYPEALVERFTHFFETDALSPDETVLWRVEEIGFAWEKIEASPILGIGFRTYYRPPFSETDTLQSFIHNGYLWLWL